MKTKEMKALIASMTLDEKLGMIHGDNVYDTKEVERLGIPPFRFSDGPMGIRGEFDRENCDYVKNTEDLATSFPCPTAIASTWNPEMGFENGNALGREVRGCGRDVSLSPGINIHRTPLCGRDFEYLSEDPFLISRIVVQMIQGIQENDVAACVKHFVANNQETRRFDVNVEMDERAFQEICLPGFKAAIQEGKSMAIMGAYNQFRGDFCCQNTYLMQDLLRGEWHFDGMVISDWGAIHDTKKAIAAGVDFDMNVDNRYDEYHYGNHLKKLIEDGEIEEKNIDNSILRILTVMDRLKMFDKDRKPGAYNTEKNRKTTRKVTRESIVLLKNDKKILPLKKEAVKSILLVGDNANRLQAFSGESSEVRALFELTPLLALKMYLSGNHQVRYARGYSSNPADEEEQLQLAKEACEKAALADAVIYVGGLNHDYDTEGKDLESMKLPYGQNTLIKELLKVRPDMVIVNMSGSPVEMQEWVDDAKTIVQYWYSGTMGAMALAEVLFGEVNPSGKLATTFPKKLEDTPAYHFGEFPGKDTVTYKDSIYVGYRYYDTFGVEPQFCFGHGLSYTDFSYSNLSVIVDSAKEENVKVLVSCDIRNIGDKKGAETVQLYVADMESTEPRPVKELKGFKKIQLAPGESKKVTFTLDESAFSFYNAKEKKWLWEKGEFRILVGSSSRDIRLSEGIEL